MQTDPVDDKTLIDGTGSLVTYLAVSGTVDAFYFKGDGSQLTGVSSSLPSGLVSSSAQLGLSSTDSPTFAGLTIRGNLTAEQFIVSSSVIYITQSFSSGSTFFGNSVDDTHRFTGSVFINGPLTVTGGITGSLFGTSSWSQYSITSSNSNTASYIDPLFISASVAAQGLAGTSDWNQITNKPANLISGSGQRSVLGLGEGDSPTFANGNFNGNVVIDGTLTARTYVVSSSVVNYETMNISGSTIFGNTIDDTHQITGSLLVTGSVKVTGSIFGDLVGTATTASYIDPLFISASAAYYGFNSGSGGGTSDWDSITNKPANLISGSGQRPILGLGEGDSPTFANGNYTGNLLVGGTLTARTYVISSSVVNYETIQVSGSTKFGDTIDDTHQFTGSLFVTGSLVINGTTFTTGTSGTSGTSGQSGTSGTSGQSGTSGTSGQSGTSGTSGTSGASGTSGTGFNTISNPSDNRILTSDGTSNAAVAESNLTFDGSNLVVTGDATITGRITAQEFYTEFISSSVLYESGSTKFGNSSDDLHQFTGSLSLSGSMGILGTQTVTGSVIVSSSLTVRGEFITPTVGTLPPSPITGSLAVYQDALWIYI